jgi:homoserine kinase
MAESVTVFAPATVANVACGFDVFGFALSEPGDTVTATMVKRSGLRIASVHGDGGRLSRDVTENVAGVAAQAVMEQTAFDGGIELSLTKGVPLASGLGGSAASSVAGALAAVRLLQLDWNDHRILECALQGEAKAAGASHADNVAPSLLGGWILVTQRDDTWNTVRLPVPDGLSCAVLRPHVEIETAASRAAMGPNVLLKDAVTQWGNTATLVAGLYEQDLDLITSALTDAVAEPARSRLVPGFAAMKDAALSSGALGCSLSGSGPAVFALCTNPDIAQEVSAAMAAASKNICDTTFDLFVSAVGAPGARVVPD